MLSNDSDFINGKTHPHSLKAYVSSFQNVTVVPELRNGNHPFIVAEYENKVQHQWPLRNKKPAEILKIMNTVSNRTGRRYASFKIWTKPKTKTESVQGQWRPGMFSTPLGLLNGKHLAHEEFLNVKASESTVYARHADFNNVKNIANQLEDLGKIKNPVLINVFIYSTCFCNVSLDLKLLIDTMTRKP